MSSMDGNKKFLVETCLLGHGLRSVKDDEILSIWPKGVNLVWFQKGCLEIGDIEGFLRAKKENGKWQRFNGLNIKDAIKEKDINMNGFLTASGTMAIAKELGYPVAVSAGIGGIGDIKEERLCYDLPALAEMGVTLVATSPKDMLDIPETLRWLENHGVKTWGVGTEYCNGYILVNENYRLSGKLNLGEENKLEYGCNLVLNPIAEENRLQDRTLLEQAIECGKEAEKQGGYYHPAANECFDRLTSGLSSKIQLQSLVSNIGVAELITNR